MSAEAWALSWSQPWDVALDRLQEDLERVEAQLTGGSLTVAPARNDSPKGRKTSTRCG